MRKLVKVCGMTSGRNIEEVEALGIDLMGFIFHPASPRFVASRPSCLPTSCKRVGVFVDAPMETVLDRAGEFGLDMVQLHGGESPEFCRKIRERSSLGIIKVFHVAKDGSFAATEAFEGLCDFFLFDTACPGGGGSGRSFDWTVLDGYSGTTPFFLSGGIGPGSAQALKEFRHPRLAGYDLNSRFETAPGLKDVTLLENFLKQIDYEQNQ